MRLVVCPRCGATVGSDTRTVEEVAAACPNSRRIESMADWLESSFRLPAGSVRQVS